ncbi:MULTISPECIES: sensor histidine kinase [Staphylococcus]|jgi:two-component system sensor histidine kinase GraS|uniref:histidine kinase n=2 Tax=Staphylococcus nepalensis TaxID=214473 RepID=A0A2T4S9Z5_9STAP|nr:MULTISPECIES: sensor histidine kinase [Staphylococcus]VDG67888.1 integral membrane sensor signal transduction histidine kinase [Lacrimispora indolis]ATH65922.1 histidine kinase [Staphylococcus nepalensis]AWI45311.1 histidine kinase [Staphylococcus nepalensis]MBO1214311.1 sensor histidine kinase [Staphylococcus nepalensis]MBO1216393.1 sensor histidine kinase [Staphylococcus nepalensis]
MDSIKWVWMFIRSRKHWILWLLFLQFIFLGIAYLDYDLSVDSILYIIILNIGLSFIFLLYTYIKEVKFLKHLDENIEPEALKHKSLADTPFQQQMVEYLYNQITTQKMLVTKQKKQIKSTEASLTDFVHDIKTPVTALKLLIEKENDGTRKRALLFEWTRINDMLDRHLFLTRLESQNKDMYYEHVDLKRLVIDEIQISRYISQAKGIDFELNFETSYKVYTDTKWCRMMIRQIISNAVKYSEHSTIHINGTLIKNHVALNIKDEGRGISQKDLPRIFDKGFTSTSNRNETTSSGIGLYLVQNVKEKLGITVHINSEMQKGTSVQFIFPNQNELVSRLSEH